MLRTMSGYGKTTAYSCISEYPQHNSSGSGQSCIISSGRTVSHELCLLIRIQTCSQNKQSVTCQESQIACLKPEPMKTQLMATNTVARATQHYCTNFIPSCEETMATLQSEVYSSVSFPHPVTPGGVCVLSQIQALEYSYRKTSKQHRMLLQSISVSFQGISGEPQSQV